MEKCVKKIIDVSFHRNGVCGVGFYSVIFENPKQGLMHASVFDELGYVAVHKISMLANKDIAFGSNSWRGDQFESELRQMIDKWLKKEGTNRIGPFALPEVKS